MLQIKDLHVRFKQRKSVFSREARVIHAVNGVSLEICRGEILGLVGESGCGKSSLSRAVMQLRKPDEGEILLESVPLIKLGRKELARTRLEFQMVFQDPFSSLNPRYTVFSTLCEALCRRTRLKGRRKEEEVARLMEKVGLDPGLMMKYPHEFSGGQRQRIAIARALAPAPKLIIADEPVSALDVSIQSQILNLLRKLVLEESLAMIFISHDLGVVHYMSDNIAVMKQGTIVEYGTASDVFHQPAHPYTKTLLSAIPGRQEPCFRP